MKPANEKCKRYLNHVSPNNELVLYNLLSSSVILSSKEKVVTNTHEHLPYPLPKNFIRWRGKNGFKNCILHQKIVQWGVTVCTSEIKRSKFISTLSYKQTEIWTRKKNFKKIVSKLCKKRLVMGLKYTKMPLHLLLQ